MSTGQGTIYASKHLLLLLSGKVSTRQGEIDYGEGVSRFGFNKAGEGTKRNNNSKSVQ